MSEELSITRGELARAARAAASGVAMAARTRIDAKRRQLEAATEQLTKPAKEQTQER